MINTIKPKSADEVDGVFVPFPSSGGVEKPVRKFFWAQALSVGSSGAPLLLRTLVAALSKVEDHSIRISNSFLAALEH